MDRIRIAYLFLAHDNPGVLARAIGRLSVENCVSLVHIDKKSNIDAFSGIRGSNVQFCKDRVPVYWGEFSQIQAILQLLRTALTGPQAPDYCVLLSGSDYPLATGMYIYRFLESNYGSEFISLTKVPAPGKPLSRINTLRFPSNKPVRQLVTRGLARLGLAQRDYRKYIGDREPYSGSTWWALTRGACQYILDFIDKNPRFVQFYENMFAADEAFFQTILGNSSFRSRICRNLHYEDWSAQGSHPAILSDRHIEHFSARQEVRIEDIFGAGEALFARKFSDTNLALLQRIDEMAHMKGAEESRSQPAP
jgi:Core-2/I-Branching enzyme